MHIVHGGHAGQQGRRSIARRAATRPDRVDVDARRLASRHGRLGLKAAGARPARTRSAEEALAKLPAVVATRRPATCAPTETAACDEQPGERRVCQWIRAPRPSLTATVDCTSGQRHVHTSAHSSLIRAGQWGHQHWPWRWLSGSMLGIGAQRPFWTWLATHTRAAGTCRVARARDLIGR